MIDWNKLPHYPFLNDILNETIYGWSKFFSSVFYWSKVNLIFWLCASSNALTWMLWLWVLFLDPTKYLAQNCWKEWCQYVFQSFITDVWDLQDQFWKNHYATFNAQNDVANVAKQFTLLFFQRRKIFSINYFLPHDNCLILFLEYNICGLPVRMQRRLL